MSFLSSKLLPLFLYPLGLAIMLCLLAMVLTWNGFKRCTILSLLIATILLWVSSTRVFADFIMGSLEQYYQPVAIIDLPKADAIVVLGGVVRGRVYDSNIADLAGSVDRLFYAARLFKEKKAELIILSGGNEQGSPSEAELMQGIMAQLGVPLGSMLLENKSRNTHSNAIQTLKILKQLNINHILLVTSGFHMKRAVAVFEAMGGIVTPAATDYQVVNKAYSILDWLPSSDALTRTTKGIKEYMGWWVYLMRGWVS